jgi:uncharacterized protein involved in response to NO
VSQRLEALVPDEPSTGTDRSAPALWSRGLRPFFLLAGVCALTLVPIWVAMLGGLIGAPTWLAPHWWHAHEMVFGFVAAAISGFLLTSVPAWTGAPPVTGGRLAALVGLWLAGRVAMTLAGLLPLVLVAVVDVAYLPVLALALSRPLLARGQGRNRGFPVILVALAAANLLTHLEALQVVGGVAHLGLRLAVFLVTLLVVIVGGRIVPAFTANALRRAGSDAEVRPLRWADRLAIPAVLLFVASEITAPRTAWSGGAAGLAALVLVARMTGWQSLRTGSDALLWSLHVGYAWVPLGLGCIALADLFGLLPWTSGLHALTAGAFGAMILAVMTRAALGHTGRPLRAPRGIPLAYLLVTLGALVRTIAPVALTERVLGALSVSAALWTLAFALFLAVYFPILTRPRVDGAPGG